ncbi:hypothetical protein ZIOFF_070949 [Zingiber officinale]|uniref:SHORT-ROOT protein n=1 Tax=Zingiber officinale TaxID=94328 RepID=A0A8J5EU97_ZINOF|nr:hypothetical protein ZIOFF_070949 [Zingiber officinale]
MLNVANSSNASTLSNVATSPNAPPPIMSARQLNLDLDPLLSVEPAKPWAADLLRHCARAFTDKDSANLHRLLWMLNELASPYGDCEQRLTYAFLQALFCRATASGDHCYSTSHAVAERTVSFASTRRLALKFQEAAPWSTFGHVAANGALLQALDGEPALHIIDVSNTFCTQWPTLLEAFTSRADADAPRALLTVVSSTAAGVVAEIEARIEKFARLMGVPLEFQAIVALALLRLADTLRPEKLELREGEAVAVNCVGALRRAGCGDSWESFLWVAAALRPRVLTVVEDEANFGAAGEFMESFEECLQFYGSYFEMLEEISQRRATSGLLWRGSASGASSDCWRARAAQTQWWTVSEGRQWCRRLERCSFETFGVSDDVIDDLKALLKRYRPGWLLLPTEGETSGMYLTWKDKIRNLFNSHY